MIRIVTDSTCDLPREIIEEYGISVVSLHVRIGPRSYREGVDITKDQFYEKMASSAEFPVTSQPSPGDFLQVYESIVREGCSILSIHLSGRLSGTVNSARSARTMILDDFESAHITIIDSLTATAGLGLVVMKAAEMVKQGLSVQVMAERLGEIAGKNRGIAMVTDLEHLHRGGRISRSKAFIGGLMNLVPLITLEEGILTPFDRSLGKKAGMDRMIDYVKKNAASLPESMAIITGTMKAEQDALCRRLSDEFPGAPKLRADLGPVIATHLGPESLVIMWF